VASFAPKVTALNDAAAVGDDLHGFVAQAQEASA